MTITIKNYNTVAALAKTECVLLLVFNSTSYLNSSFLATERRSSSTLESFRLTREGWTTLTLLPRGPKSRLPSNSSRWRDDATVATFGSFSG